jgi:bifunctional non-homologous end joining protein LigD
MKAKLVGSMPSGDWIYEIKFDGYRALALRGGSETRVLSRNEKDLGGKFPEVKDSIAALNIQDAIIVGEIVALDEKGRSSFHWSMPGRALLRVWANLESVCTTWTSSF